MKKSILTTILILLIAALFSCARAAEEVTAIYGETYMCGDAYTVSIMTQPQMMAKIDEKLKMFVYRRDFATGRIKPYQISVVYDTNTEEDVLLVIRMAIRNMNSRTLSGLSQDSFILTGKVRDRVIEYKPEVMMPFVMDESDWLVPLVRQGVEAYSLGRTIPDIENFYVQDYWNPLLIEEKPFDSMRLQEIRLIYRIPSFLVGWELHVRPQPADGDMTGLRSCDLTMALPTFMNEITREVYKYIY